MTIPGAKNADTAKVTDVALMLGPLAAEAMSEIPAYFDDPARLADDVWIGKFPLHARVLAACQSPGENWERHHEFSIYAVWRDGGKYFVDGRAGFNNDRRLSTVIQLSRLIRPTNLGFTRAARLVEWRDYPLEIIPARAEGRGAVIFIAEPSMNWIRDIDVPEIRNIIAAFSPAALPERVQNAMRHFEYAHGLDDFYSRWPLVTTAVEALIHTDERRKTFGPKGMRITDQFVRRLEKLGQLVPGVTWTAADLEQAYEDRSGFAHGAGVGSALPTDVLQRYRAFEQNVRVILRQLVLNASLANMFVDDSALRSYLNP